MSSVELNRVFRGVGRVGALGAVSRTGDSSALRAINFRRIRIGPDRSRVRGEAAAFRRDALHPNAATYRDQAFDPRNIVAQSQMKATAKGGNKP